jgi:hypothetical protein
VTTPRVGGSPADAQFRAAQQASGKRYQEARTTCRAKPSAERTGCVTAAKTELKQAQAEARGDPRCREEGPLTRTASEPAALTG